MTVTRGSYDLASAKQAHDDAETKATNYITKVDDAGITVHPYDDTNGVAVTSDRAVINANGMTIYKNDTDVAAFGDTARIGKEQVSNITIEDTQIIGTTIYGSPFFIIASDGGNGDILKSYTAGNFVLSDSSAQETVNIKNASPMNWQEIQTGDDFVVYINHYYTYKNKIDISMDGVTTHTVTCTKGTSSYDGHYSYDGNESITVNGYTLPVSVDVHDPLYKYTTIVIRYVMQGNTPTFSVGFNNEVLGAYSTGIGYEVKAIGDTSIATGWYSRAYGQDSHAEGTATWAGDSTDATKGRGAHSEGQYTRAIHSASHAEGTHTRAEGFASHTGGSGTIAKGNYETVIGKWNKESVLDLNNLGFAFIIGNGTSDSANDRSNALTVDWNGKISTPQMQAGTISSTSVSANSYTDVTVTFTATMSATPTVVCSVVSTSTAGAIGSITAAVTSTSTTSFTCRIFNAGSSARTPAVNWIALNV